MILAALLILQAGFAERKLGEIPEGAKVDQVFAAPDGAAAGYSLNDGKQAWAVRGDWKTKPFDILSPSALSADGRHLLYVTAHLTEGRRHLWLDDKILQTFERETFHTFGALSRDGSVAVLMVGSQDKDWRTYAVNGKVGAPHPFKHLTPPRISLDGKTVAGQGTTRDDDVRVVVNDVLGPVYDNVAGPAVSENGVVAYVGEKPDGSLALHHGDKVSTLDGLLPEDVFINADGTTLGYVISDKGQFVKVGAETYPKLKRILRAAFDARGEKVVFWGLDLADKPWVGVDARRFEAPGILTPPVFSPDGSKVGYATQVGRDLMWKVIDLSK